MEKNLIEEILSNDRTQFTSQTEKENQKGVLFLKNYKHKNTVSFAQTKLKKAENNILSLNYNNTNSNISNITNSNISNTNSNLIKTNIKTNENSNSPKNSNLKLFSYKRRSSLVPNISNLSINNQNNILSNSINLKSFFKINQSKKENIKYLPLISSTDKNNQNDVSFKSKNTQEKFVKTNLLKNNKLRSDSVFERKKPKMKLSVENIKLSNNKENERSSFQSSKRYMKMKTILNLNKQFDFLANEIEKQKEEEKEENEDEENDEQTKRDKKGFKNKKLLYSKKVNNYIFKIYKAKPQNKTERKKVNLIINNDFKSPRNKSNINKKKSINTYLNDFNPNIYIKKMKNKIKKSNLGNSKEIKSKILKKAKDYINNLISKNNKSMKKKYDILDKIKIKNMVYVEKERKALVNKIINEILLKIHFRHKKTIFKIFIDNLLISQFVKFNIFIKLNIMRHVLTKSEKDENLYFINLIRHLLYPKDQIISTKYTFIKNIGDITSSIVKRTTTVDRFLEINKKDIYYIYFSIKFQLLDCETIIHLFENKKFDIKNIKKIGYKASCATLFVENKSDPVSEKESENFSEVEKRLKRMNRRSKHSRRTTYINKIRFTNSSKILNLNLTKNIISLRNPKNIRDILRNKTSLNLNKIQELYTKKLKKSKELSDSSDASFDYKKYSKKFKLSTKKLIFSNHTSEDEDDEIHQRDKILLFQHFIYFTKYSQYDKLLHWLKKSGKYLDLNYKMDNGDGLLHLCVRNSLPHYIYKYLIIHGVDINSQNNKGDTALHLAVQHHKYKTIDFLIKMGASEYIYNKNRKLCWECL